MAGIRLEWAQFGDFDSFDVIRSNASMANIADEDLPSPIATGLTTMDYVDTAVVADAAYYYKVRVWRDDTSVVSDEISAIASTPDEHWSNVVVRLTFNTDFTDSTGGIWVTHNEPLIDENGKFGSCLDSRNGYLSCASSIDLYLDADFTIEFWMYALDSANNADNLIISSGKADSWSFGIAAVNYFKGAKKVLLYNYNAGNYEVNNIEINEWAHICFSKTGSTLRTFKNGILQNTYSDSRIYPFNTNGTYLCRDAWSATNGSYQYDFKGYIDDLRITKGVGRHINNFSVLKEFPTHG